ncbi:chaperone protein dnaJ-related [Melia azedarach]|uniref:Chaperone protein dnaJ-related n=1 Tax=Melia azedarach TaxID=155640 RepID=A0ACC1X8W6_MELAZ|nr:chaperone protein dnaJ-related [Melia azedarach]
MAISTASPAKLNFLPMTPLSAPRSRPSHLLKLKPAHCAAPLQEEVDVGIMCEPCNGKGWLVCDYCGGQKTNVKAPNNRIYRRCPSCRAVGYVLCSKCKVFKCVTFPNYNDGEELFL